MKWLYKAIYWNVHELFVLLFIYIQKQVKGTIGETSCFIIVSFHS